MRKFFVITYLMGLLAIAMDALAAEPDSVPQRIITVPGLKPIYLAYEASMNLGYIMPDGKVDAKITGTNTPAYPLSRPVMGAKLAMRIRPRKGRAYDALSDWNDAACGVALDYLNLGNNQWLGSIIAPYTFLDIPIVRTPHFRLGIRPGIGMGFATKTYRTTIDDTHLFNTLYQADGHTIANQCVGSVTNFYFAEALYLEFPIMNGFSIIASGGWYHMSNGSTIQPNSGYNMLNAQLGLVVTPYATAHHEDNLFVNIDENGVVTPRHGPKKLPFIHGWDVEMSASGGFRQVYYRDQATFGVGSISLAAHYRPWSIFKIGAGLDVFFDGAYTNRETKFGKTYVNLATPADCWRMGLSLQPEFTVGRFSAGFHFGIYLLDNVKNLEYSNDTEKATLAGGQRLDKPVVYAYNLLKAGSAGNPDGWLYTRILLKYRPTDHFFVQVGMKSHLMKAEFVDAGIGFYFGDNK